MGTPQDPRGIIHLVWGPHQARHRSDFEAVPGAFAQARRFFTFPIQIPPSLRISGSGSICRAPTGQTDVGGYVRRWIAVRLAVLGLPPVPLLVLRLFAVGVGSSNRLGC